MDWLKLPKREYIAIGALMLTLLLSFIVPNFQYVVLGVAVIASLPTLWQGLRDALKFKITIDVFSLKLWVITNFEYNAPLNRYA